MDEINPKGSVIVAIYKSEKFLDKLIRSIMEQTYRNLEIILVDDGSPDKSGEICDAYAAQDERIRVIHKKNGGACEARNVGMAAASGEWIVIVDGDDWLETDYVEYMLHLVHTTDSDMGMSTNIFTTRNRKQVEEDRVETWTNEKACAMLIYPYIPIGPWNKIYKAELLRKNNITFSRPWSGEGLHFSTTAAQYANHVGVGRRKVYNYRLNNVNSGLTHYNLQMGLNAAENIRYIGEHLVVDTPTVRNAVNWHIWKNNGYVIFLIIATDSLKENRALYKNCRKNLLVKLPAILVKSKVGGVQSYVCLSKRCSPSGGQSTGCARKGRLWKKILWNKRGKNAVNGGVKRYA